MNNPKTFQKPDEINGLMGEQSTVDPERAALLRKKSDMEAASGMRARLSEIKGKPLDEARIKPAEAEKLVGELEARVTSPLDNADRSKR
jgi:hypothetical protein